MGQVVEFPELAAFALPPVKIGEIREDVEKRPLRSLARAAMRAYVRARVAARRNRQSDSIKELYFAAFCFARLADEGGASAGDGPVVTTTLTASS